MNALTTGHLTRETGFALLPVVMGIALLGVITFMISRESASNLDIARQAEKQASNRALLDAALARGEWLVMNSDCQVPANLETQSFDGQTYSLNFSGSSEALDISTVFTTPDGTVISDSMTGIVMYDYANPRQLELTASDDAYMRLQLLNNNEKHGNDGEIKVKRKSNDNRRGLIKFDLSQIPPGSKVDSASLQLYMNKADSSENDIAFHVLETDWDEASVSGSVPWNSTGGDFSNISELVMPGTKTTGSYSFNLLSLVQRWVNLDIGNYGILLKMVTESSGDSEYKFRSSEHGDPVQRPKLLVNYVCQCGVPCDSGFVLEDLLLGTEKTVDIAGQNNRAEDLVRYSPAGPAAELFFDGSTVGLTEDIRGVHRLANNRLILALKGPTTLNGVNFQPEDLIEFDPEDGLFRMFMDGSNYDIDQSISSIALRADGLPVISLENDDNVFGVQYQKTDLFAVDLQARTSELVLDGSTNNISREIDASHITPDGQFLLSFKDTVTMDGRDFNKGDIVQYDAGSATVIAYFDGGQFSDATRLTALHSGDGSGSVSYADMHFPFEADTGGTTPDIIGSREGTLIGSPEWVPGGLKGAMRFDGIDDELQVPNDQDLQLDSDFSISMWIYHEGDRSGVQHLLTKRSIPEPELFELGLSDGSLFWKLGKEAEAVEFGSYSDLEAATWHHIAITFDTLANKAAFYLDGEQLESVDTSFIPVSNEFDLHFGQGFQGVIDEIRMHKRTLSAFDVKSILEQGEPVDPDASGSEPESLPPAPDEAPGCNGSYADFFNASSYSNSDGTLAWTDPWNESRDDNKPNSGKIEITDKRLRLSDDDRALYRKLPIGSASSAALAFNVVNMAGSVSGGNHLAVYISNNGTDGPWTELVQLKRSDISPVAMQFNIDSFIGNDTWISFDTSSDSSNFDWYEVDNIQIRCQ